MGTVEFFREQGNIEFVAWKEYFIRILNLTVPYGATWFLAVSCDFVVSGPRPGEVKFYTKCGKFLDIYGDQGNMEQDVW